jgi:hypothetical protein
MACIKITCQSTAKAQYTAVDQRNRFTDDLTMHRHPFIPAAKEQGERSE